MSDSLRSDLEKLEVPKMIVWVDKKMKVETTHLTDKTIDEILDLIDSKMPEKLEVDSENHKHMTEAQYQFIVGKNEALSEVKSILKGGTV